MSESLPKEYSQGVCEDGAAILRDGRPLTIEEILEGLRERDKLQSRFSELEARIDELEAALSQKSYLLDGLRERWLEERAAWEAENATLRERPEIDTDYPRDIFSELILKNSPYAFYLFQWVPYQTDAKQWRLKMCHDVKTFDGREAHGIWPNGSSCGPFKDEEVEFIRISKEQHGWTWQDPRGQPHQPAQSEGE